MRLKRSSLASFHRIAGIAARLDATFASDLSGRGFVGLFLGLKAQASCCRAFSPSDRAEGPIARSTGLTAHLTSLIVWEGRRASPIRDDDQQGTSPQRAQSEERRADREQPGRGTRSCFFLFSKVSVLMKKYRLSQCQDASGSRRIRVARFPPVLRRREAEGETPKVWP